MFAIKTTTKWKFSENFYIEIWKYRRFIYQNVDNNFEIFILLVLFFRMIDKSILYTLYNIICRSESSFFFWDYYSKTEI